MCSLGTLLPADLTVNSHCTVKYALAEMITVSSSASLPLIL